MIKKFLVVVAVAYSAAGILIGGIALARTEATSITHQRFSNYVAEAELLFGDVVIGSPCEDWPAQDPEQIHHLKVLPASNGNGEPCIVVGWAYSNAFPGDLPSDVFLDEGSLQRAPIFDADGRVIGHFDSPEMESGTLDEDQLSGFPETP